MLRANRGFHQGSYQAKPLFLTRSRRPLRGQSLIMSCESPEALDFDDAMSSRSSAFDPMPSPPESPESRPKRKKKKRKSVKKKRDARHAKRKKEKKPPRGASSRAVETAHLAQPEAPQGPSGSGAQEMECEASTSLPPNLGRWVFQAFWEPVGDVQLPKPPPKRRAAAKMLVRAGLRCTCHFALIADCPLSRPNQVRDPVENDSV